MKKILLVLTALLAAGTAGAQENEEWSRWSVTPHVGLNVSRLGGSAEPYWFGTAVGPGAGVEAEWRFSRWLGLSLGVGYEVLGNSTEETKQYLSKTVYPTLGKSIISREEKYCNRLRLNYIQVPLLLNVHVWKGLTLRTGVILSDVTSARLKGTHKYVHSSLGFSEPAPLILDNRTESELSLTVGRRPQAVTDEDIEDPVWLENGKLDQGFKKYCHNIDVNIPVEATYEYRSFVLGVGYQFGLRGVCRGEAHLENSFRRADYVYNRNLSIRLGYRINL